MHIEHVIVDGSNIATEGRDAPSLAQLDEAVKAFIEEYTPNFVTVVVDATFPNRIDRKERDTYEDAVNANELITPPAGAIGRGDAFVLQIARRAGASILSNDSFQEFHGDHPWLFDRGRLIGGKPVPHVGWVFMERAPVRGPTSRRAVSEARKGAKAAKTAAVPAEAVGDDEDAASASAEPEGPAPAKATRARRPRASKASKAAKAAKEAPALETAAAEVASPGSDGQAAASARSGRGVEPYNEALPFIEFVGRHAVGSEVEATVERFSSHGAYVTIGPARAYVPLRNLAEPAPRSAKGLLRLGESRRFVVVSIDPPRRGIDLALPGVVDVPAAPLPDLGAIAAEVDDTVAAVPGEQPAKRTRSRKKAAAAEPAPAEEAPARKATRSRKKAAEAPAGPAAEVPARQATRSRRKAAAPAAAEVPAKKATRSRKKSAATAAGSVVTDLPEVVAEPPAPAKKAARTRKKAAAKAAGPVVTELPTVVSDEPAPAKKAARSRKGAVSNGDDAAAPARRATRPRKKAAVADAS
jgi:Zc3h12a-like Ribonuclease NYN domain/S1 RNA binding domain